MAQYGIIWQNTTIMQAVKEFKESVQIVLMQLPAGIWHNNIMKAFTLDIGTRYPDYCPLIPH